MFQPLIWNSYLMIRSSHLSAFVSTLLSPAFVRQKVLEAGTLAYDTEPSTTNFWFHLESVDAMNNPCIRVYQYLVFL